MVDDSKETQSDTGVRSQKMRLGRLQQRRVHAPRDESLEFLAGTFKQQIAKPFRQLEGVVEAWAQLVPDDLQRRSRLESLQRGVLTVAVDSSATHFLFDEHVRRGLAVKIAESSKGAVLRKIRLRVEPGLFTEEADGAFDDHTHGPHEAFDAEQEFDPELPR